MYTDLQDTHYHPPIKSLHWLIALLVFAVIPLGFLQLMVKDEFYSAINEWHVWLGFTVFLLMLVRVLTRLLTSTPGALSGTGPMTHYLARCGHYLLYLVLLLEPVLGFLTTNAQGFPLVLFGRVQIWSPVGESEVLTDRFLTMHHRLAWVIVVLIVLHVAGALYHRVVLRDATLERIS